LLPVRFPCKTA